MEVVLLGSGSADGWPNPFCGCASCQAQRADRRRRVSTSALVDARLLLDMGPDTARQAELLGVDLRGVRDVLVTHAHPDHLAPATLLWRAWATGGAPVTVHGPQPVVDEVQRWFADDPSVTAQALHAGDEVQIAGLTVRALPAAHEVATLLYDVTDAAGARLLYATDTGPLPADTVAACAGRAYDLALVEQTFGRHTVHGTLHLDLATFPRVLGALRANGALTDRSRVLAVHLSHHNPPEDELSTVLARWGAAPGLDGLRVRIRPEPAEAPVADSPSGEHPQRVLVLGGTRSGKSALAESLLADVGAVTYVATGGERDDDPDWRARVERHQARRPAGWTTESSTDLVGLLRADGPPLLIDCLTLWLTAVMDDAAAWHESAWHASGRARVSAQVDALLAAWRTTTRRVVAVSNETGSGVVPDTWAGRVFRDEMGRLNARLAAECDAVSLVVAGLENPLR